MNKLKQLHFIVNPISGKGKSLVTEKLLHTHFPVSEYTIDIQFTKYKKHAIELVHEAIQANTDLIVACGGDGTINEVASQLVNSKIPLGIIPQGSGNGLSSNLKIPRNLDQALQVIKNFKVDAIDVGKINDHFFFSNTGIGFDASLIKHYELSQKRTLKGYIQAGLTAFFEKKKSEVLLVKKGENQFSILPFLIFVSNSNEMGYRMSITPKASLQDGLLDVVMIPQTNPINKVIWSTSLLLKKSHWFQKIQTFQTNKIQLEGEEITEFEVQIDGEFKTLLSKEITIQVLPKSLKILMP